MRQAGRYMSEYRSLRERYSLLDICRTPDLATEVTLQPVRRIEVDAAILFSDLLLPLEPLGIPFDFIRGEGPAIEKPLRSEADLARVRRFEPRESLGYVLEAIRQIKRALAGRVPLIGFAGAPFTLASYAIEGGHSSNFAHTKALMYGAPAAWHRFCDTLADVIGDYLVAQIEAGVDAVQVFDSWVGALNAADYREFILPHTTADLRSRTAGSAGPTAPCRRFISASAPGRFSARCAKPAATSSAPTGARRSTKRGIASAPIAPSRAISIRRCCSARSIASSPRPTMSWRARAAAPATSSISVTVFCRRRRSSTSRRSRGTCIRRRGR